MSVNAWLRQLRVCLFSMGTPGPYSSSTLNVGGPSFGVLSSMPRRGRFNWP